ncbi:hypothetical protein FRC02_000705 [Tulasnella sp. 418]|nr:hypothetical protein FRC02_000705 [Tulasnella sp. 418]
MADKLDDDYVRRTAVYIRTNEERLAGALKSKGGPSIINPLTWMNAPAPSKPIVFSISKSQLAYLLARIEEIGINVGCLDIPIENPRLATVLPSKEDNSDARSISSFVSNLSLSPSSWWSAPTPIENELKYIYSSFTKLPALHINNPPSHTIEKNAVPLDAFKNLQSLVLEDVDPRSLLGWDRLADSLRSLTIHRSGIEDVSHLIIDAVAEDQARRQNGDLTPIRRGAQHRHTLRRSRHPSWQSGQLPSSIPEDEEHQSPPSPISSSSSSGGPATPPQQLSSTKWRFLRYFNVSDNGLTFFPTQPLPYLTSLTHLDISNNLLVSVPSGLGQLFNLVSLNLSNNMIESVLGIYTLLGQVLTLNVSHNRLESLCGLERLPALERIDLRNNRIDESAEVGRLSVLPNVSEVWVSGNPMETVETDYRVKCYSYFVKEGREILLDGYAPGYMERGRIDALVGTPKLAAAPTSTSHSKTDSSSANSGPPAVSVTSASTPTLTSPPGAATSSSSATSSAAPSPVITAVHSNNNSHSKAGNKRRKQTRLVDFDAGGEIVVTKTTTKRSRAPSDGAHTKSRDISPNPMFITNGLGVGALSASPLAATVGLPDEAGPSSLPQDPPQLLSNPRTASNATTDSSAEKENDAFGELPPKSAFMPSSPPKHANTGGLTKTMGRHSRRATDFAPLNEIDGPSSMTAEDVPQFRGRRAPTSGSQTISGTNSPGSKRRARVSASVFEPAPSSSPAQQPAQQPPAKDSELKFASEADAFRAKIEALRNEVGDSWLKVLSQSGNLSPPTPTTLGGSGNGFGENVTRRPY